MLHENKAMNDTENYEALAVEQAVATQHLRILKDKDVLTVRRDGKNSYYALAKDAFYDIVAVMRRAI